MRRLRMTFVVLLAFTVAACTSSKHAANPTAPSQTGSSSIAQSPAASIAQSPAAQTATSTGGTGAASVLNVTRDGPTEPIFAPVMATDDTFALMYLIYDPLVGLAPNQSTIEPRLAASWTVSPDAKTYTFNLRQGVKWQDGQPFTAADVAFTATFAAHYPGAFQGRAQNWKEIAGAADIANTDKPLSGISAVGDYTVKITLAQPDSSFLRYLVDAPNVILPQHLLATETDKTIASSSFVTHPIGTGPYRLTQYVPNQYVQFTANADYWGGAPKTKTLIWKILSSSQIASQLQTGGLDVAFGLQEADRTTLSGVKGLNLGDALSAGMVGLFVRTAAPALSDPRVRQAMYYGIDRQALVTGVMKSEAGLLWNPPGLNFDSLNKYPYDPNQAKSLLAAAGWKSSTTLRLVYWSGAQQAQQVLPIIQQELGKIGMKVTLVPLTEDDWNDMVTNPARVNQWDLDYEFGGTYGLGPQFSAVQYNVCNGPVGETGWKNCTVSGLFAKAGSTTDSATQSAAYAQIAQMINQAPDAIYLWQPKVLSATAAGVSGVTVYPFDRYSFLKAAEWSKQ